MAIGGELGNCKKNFRRLTPYSQIIFKPRPYISLRNKITIPTAKTTTDHVTRQIPGIPKSTFLP